MHHFVLLPMLLASQPSVAGEPSAAKLARKCDKGQASACLELAERWRRAAEEACEAGAVPACLGLADAQLTGLGTGDAHRAVRAYEDACYRGSDAACRRMATIGALRDDPSRPVAQLTVLVSPAGIGVEGVAAAFLAEYADLEGEILLPCTVDGGCSRAAHFDWDTLSEILERLHRGDPGRTQVVLRTQALSYEVLLEGAHRIAGPAGEPFPALILPEASP